MNIKWRPYQIECKNTIKQEYDKGVKKQLAVLATGLGKRLMAVDLMQHFQRSLFIAHREELIAQAYEEISTMFPMQCGVIKGTRFEIDKRIVIASAQTLYRRLDKMPKDMFGYIAVDECHHYAAQSFLIPLRHFEAKLVVGWTATPKRLDGLSLSNVAEKLVFQYGIDNGVKDGWLAKPDAYSIRTGSDLSRVHRVGGDFNQAELSEIVDSPERNTLVVNKYKEYTKGEQSIAFCVDIKHAYNLRDKFRDAGISCETVVSDPQLCPDRAEIVRAFSKGEIQVLTNVNILTEGFDYSDVGCVLMARPTQSETLYVQSIGRGTRLKSMQFQEKFGHDHCIILDFVDNTGKHSLVNSYALEKDKPIEERIYISEENKQKLIEAREARKVTIQIKTGPDRRVDLLRLPDITVWQSERMLEPATEKQLEWLKSVGVFVEGIEYTKLQASEIISSLPCKQWQMEFLAGQGYDISHGASVGQFQKVYASYKNKNKYKIN